MILDIIISTYNKEKTIIDYYNKIEEELKNIKHRYIFVDDASTDKTLDALKNIYKKNESNIKIVSLSKHYGKDTSIYTGLLHTSHELMCIIDTDLELNTKQITKMYDLFKNKDIDSACIYSNHKEKSFNKIKTQLINKIYNLNIDNNKTYFRMFRKNVKEALINISNQYPFSNYSFNIIGFNTTYISYDIKKEEDNINIYICYSEKPFNILKSFNLILILLLFVYFVLSLLDVFRISNNILLLILLIFNVINIYLLYLTCEYFDKQKTYFTIKEKIGFEDNVL